MSKKRHSATAGRPIARKGPVTAPARRDLPSDRRTQIGLLVVVLVLITVVVLGADFVIGAVTGSGAGSSPAATATVATNAGPTQFGQTVPGIGGHWTNVSPAQLAQMLTAKDFTLVNVKTPYMGEIDGTDLYIPYDQLKGHASELPGDKGAKLLVYCRSGGESAVAAQTLLDLGYTNIWNLDGGMNAWTASGRKLVQKSR